MAGLGADRTRNKRDGSLTIIDGSTTPVKTTVDFAEGDFKVKLPKEGEPIPIKTKTGDLHHIKKGDKFNGFGSVTFSWKYANRNIRDKLLNPAKTSADSDDGVPAGMNVVNLEYTITDDLDATKGEVRKLFNVYFEPANVDMDEGDDANKMAAEGVIYGKWDAATQKRIFEDWGDKT